jgi:hypothetical protein
MIGARSGRASKNALNFVGWSIASMLHSITAMWPQSA